MRRPSRIRISGTDARDVGVFKARQVFLDEFPGDHDLPAALDFAERQIVDIGRIAISYLGRVLEMGLDDAAFARDQEKADSAEAVPFAGFQALHLQASVSHDFAEFDDGIDLADAGDKLVVGPLVLRVFLEALEFEFPRDWL